MPLLSDVNRNSFYRYSEVLVERGDHLRFQDIKLSYEFHNLLDKQWLKSVTLFVFANNIGLLWTQNKLGIDPDVVPMVHSFRTPTPLSLSVGLQLNL